MSFLCCINYAQAEIISLPKTGQTTCYGPTGGIISCGGTRQDGETATGVAVDGQRFTLNQDYTVTDNLTGLMWTQNANIAGAKKTWSTALSYIDGMNNYMYPNLGYNDWRLPNIVELASLIDHGHSNPALPDNHPFTNVQANYFSSTTAVYYLPSTAWAMILSLSDGGGNAGSKTAGFYIWPVRGGSLDGTVDPNFPANLQTTGLTVSYGSHDDGNKHVGITRPNPRFTDNGDNTVTDNLTGLMWTKNTRLNGYNTWQSALDHIGGMNLSNNVSTNFGHKDWRLPNIVELMSVGNYGYSKPGLETGHPFTNIVSNIGNWSSTNATIDPTQAYYIMPYQWSTPYKKAKTQSYCAVWAVRSITPSEGFLFPLQDVTAYTAPVSSVMDHNGTTPYEKNGVITLFNGEEGLVEYGCYCYTTSQSCSPSDYTNCFAPGFKSSNPSQYFLDGILNYNDVIAFYDGHPGYDYPTPTGTDIHVPESGTLCVATTTTQKPQPADLWRNTTKCPLPGVVITNWLSHHTFYIIHKNVLLNDSIDDYMTVFLHNDNLELSMRLNIEQNGYALITRDQHVAESGEFGSPGAQHMHMETYKWNRTTSTWDRVDPYGDGVNNILWEQN